MDTAQQHTTFDTTELVNSVNSMLAQGPSVSFAVRQGAMQVLEQVLHATGNYRGFRYLTADEVADGAPGINMVSGQIHPDPVLRFVNTDCTRVKYF